MAGDLDIELYDVYPRAAIVAVAGAHAREACGGQVIIGRDRLAWLASPPEGSFPAPSRFRWNAQGRYREADDDFWFLPAEVRDRAAPTNQGIEMFFATDEAGAFLYVGAGWLVSYGFSGSASLGEAYVDLHHKLPEDIWLRFGGYEGWSLTVDDEERRGLSTDEVLAMVRLQSRKARASSGSLATRRTRSAFSSSQGARSSCTSHSTETAA